MPVRLNTGRRVCRTATKRGPFEIRKKPTQNKSYVGLKKRNTKKKRVLLTDFHAVCAARTVGEILTGCPGTAIVITGADLCTLTAGWVVRLIGTCRVTVLEITKPSFTEYGTTRGVPAGVAKVPGGSSVGRRTSCFSNAVCITPNNTVFIFSRTVRFFRTSSVAARGVDTVTKHTYRIIARVPGIVVVIGTWNTLAKKRCQWGSHYRSHTWWYSNPYRYMRPCYTYNVRLVAGCSDGWLGCRPRCLHMRYRPCMTLPACSLLLSRKHHRWPHYRRRAHSDSQNRCPWQMGYRFPR